MTISLRDNAGEIIDSTISARAAANNKNSDLAEKTEELSRRIFLIFSAKPEPPGSLVKHTGKPSPDRCFSRIRAWVDLPEPSPPSKEINKTILPADTVVNENH